jgi:hypothetical protein
MNILGTDTLVEFLISADDPAYYGHKRTIQSSIPQRSKHNKLFIHYFKYISPSFNSNGH